MISFLIHDSAGRILRRGICAPHMLALQARAGEHLMVASCAEIARHVATGRLSDAPVVAPGAAPPPCTGEIDAQRQLVATDWYALRLAETGQPMPAAIRAARAEARATLSRLRAARLGAPGAGDTALRSAGSAGMTAAAGDAGQSGAGMAAPPSLADRKERP